uniref:Uncharacterized protein n=1 Tax=Romanomermis culicivorax TaxID=13658 RepID=A0A915KVN7_ROMCU
MPNIHQSSRVKNKANIFGASHQGTFVCKKYGHDLLSRCLYRTGFIGKHVFDLKIYEKCNITDIVVGARLVFIINLD